MNQLVIRKVWESDNGKYRVNVRKYDDGSILVGAWKIVNGKLKDIRFRDVPSYVVVKINEMKDEVKSF